MSLDLNTALYRASGVDVNSVAATSSQILKSAGQNHTPQVQAIDYSKFNRATLGVDLYSARTNVELQKQIALTQAGLYAQAIDVANLNAKAAANLYSAATVQKNVELTQSIQATELNPAPKVERQANIVQLFNISDKNSNSSNAQSFNPFSTNEEKSEEQKESNSFNLFA
ncbi:MAG: hypothetical protein IJ003_04950 [Candidatus Gastranaerophilales bacterium]|nr:hypothetical protein [Candidatus Gastranaerophilales bacterium]